MQVNTPRVQQAGLFAILFISAVFVLMYGHTTNTCMLHYHYHTGYIQCHFLLSTLKNLRDTGSVVSPCRNAWEWCSSAFPPTGMAFPLASCRARWVVTGGKEHSQLVGLGEFPQFFPQDLTPGQDRYYNTVQQYDIRWGPCLLQLAI